MSKIKFSILLQTSILLITKVHLNIKDISKFIQHSTKYHLHPLYLQNQIFYPNSNTILLITKIYLNIKDPQNLSKSNFLSYSKIL